LGEEALMSTMHIATATRSYLRSVERVAARTAAWGMAERLTAATAGMRVALDRLPDGSPHQFVELRDRAAVIAAIPAPGTAEHATVAAAYAVFSERAIAWAVECGVGTRPNPRQRPVRASSIALRPEPSVPSR